MKLSPEEIPSRIQAITGKRGRPRNAEKAKTKETPAVKRGRGRPPKVKMVDLLSKTDARLLKRLEAQGTPSPAPPAQVLPLAAHPAGGLQPWHLLPGASLLLCPRRGAQR